MIRISQTFALTIFGLLAWSNAGASTPAFVKESLFASNQTTVHAVHSTQHADIVLLEEGIEAGFSIGMRCQVKENDSIIGELIIVSVGRGNAAGLITTLQDDAIIHPGSFVTIKTL